MATRAESSDVREDGGVSALFKNRSFSAFTLTQFLGAFNDNLFKQLISLVAVNRSLREGGGSYEGLAAAVFALPFVLFTGIAGNLADRLSKTRVIVWMKVAEVAIMLCGAAAFLAGSLELLLVVLFFMGAQSAFFGPAKYGILPELLHARSLARGNGVILMTTWVSIILGMAAAGWLMEHSKSNPGLPVLACVAVAALGTLTSLGIRYLPPARPDLRIPPHPFGDLFHYLAHIARDRMFLLVVLVNSFLWFLGGVMQPALNRYGRGLMGLSEEATSRLLVTLSLGMAGGAVLGGLLSRRAADFRLTVWGLAGAAVSLALLAFAYHHVWTAHAVLFLVGAAGGMFGVPLQTYIQARPAEEEKGRAVAAANFVNWIFIFLSAGYYSLVMALSGDWVPAVPLSLALLTIAVGLAAGPRLLRAGGL